MRTAKLVCHLTLSVVVAGCASSSPTAKTEPANPPAAATEKPSPATQKPAAPSTQKSAPGTVKPGSPAAPQATNATPAAPAAPKAMIATSGDGTKIAYEVTGSGPAVLLVHGGGQTRRTWNQLGYVDRLSKRFTVITFDQRGIGESDKPMAPAAYALDRVLGDLLAVADAAKAQRFHLWGFGHGATIGRHVAARSDRVISAVLVGATMGPTVTGVFKDAITGMKAKWQPAIDAQAAGKLDVAKLSPSDRAAWEGGMAVTVFTLTALMDFPAVEPAEIKAPTLWVMGADDSAMENVKQYEAKLAATKVTLKILPSINYSDSFIKMDQVMSEVEPFLIKHAAT